MDMSTRKGLAPPIRAGAGTFPTYHLKGQPAALIGRFAIPLRSAMIRRASQYYKSDIGAIYGLIYTIRPLTTQLRKEFFK